MMIATGLATTKTIMANGVSLLLPNICIHKKTGNL
jgi:hypothetical protein